MGWRQELAWESPPGVRTWQLTEPGGRVCYLKTAPVTASIPLRAEAARIRWAGLAGLPVPTVLAACSDGQSEWLLTEALPGVSAVDPSLKADPAMLVAMLAAGLRGFHQTPVGDCPFRFGPDDLIADATGRVLQDLVQPADMHSEHAHLTPHAALTELRQLRPDRPHDLVVCHGDYCLPNVVISDGAVTGYVDLGDLAVADRWYDLAIATWSITWNLGPAGRKSSWRATALPGMTGRSRSTALATTSGHNHLRSATRTW